MPTRRNKNHIYLEDKNPKVLHLDPSPPLCDPSEVWVTLI